MIDRQYTCEDHMILKNNKNLVLIQIPILYNLAIYKHDSLEIF